MTTIAAVSAVSIVICVFLIFARMIKISFDHLRDSNRIHRRVEEILSQPKPSADLRDRINGVNHD